MQRGDGRSLIEIITTAMEEAQQCGQDHGGQIDHAIAAIILLNPASVARPHGGWWRRWVHEGDQDDQHNVLPLSLNLWR